MGQSPNIITPCIMQFAKIVMALKISFLSRRSSDDSHLRLIYFYECVHAKSLQSCPMFCDLVDSRPPSSSVCGIFQASKLEWVALSFSRESSQPKSRAHISSNSCTAGAFFTAEPPGKPIYFLPLLNL